MAARDILVIGAVVFAFALVLFVIFFASNTIISSMVGISAINQSNATVEVLTSTASMTNQFDYVVFGLFIGMILGLLITSWYVAGNPIFTIAYFLVVTVGVLISAIISNVWETTTQASVFGSTIASFPITNHLMTNLPMYMAVIGFIGIVIIFGKPSNPEGYG